jgi:hypothetical protein
MPSPKRSWTPPIRNHTTLGPGLLESVYHAALAYELAQRGLRTVSQQAIPVVYGDSNRHRLPGRSDCRGSGDRRDPSVEALAPVHRKQFLTYLRLADKRLGLLINLNAAPIKDGISRIVNGLEEEGRRVSPKGARTPRKPVKLRGSMSHRFEAEDLASRR